ncbi:ATP-binding cassette, subfamily B [Faunimonas pinastri]|uniref:ATP-binding cassette, subfamily B n=1 Tax=Faunimonas pinastri TaxID=1855383 RepID=A0A1H9FXD7_9HYPH|nr:ABC transporter ATP-binding protein [Faunimonas pinastri]SEQ42469.1 ATP-binding cassette, subfamily B [Faunimonas pinastri]
MKPILAKLAGNGEKKGTLYLLKRLMMENARDYLWHYAFAFALMGVVAATTAASAWIIKDVINKIFIERNSGMVWAIALSVIGIYLVKGLASYGQDMMLARIGNNIVARNQKRIYRHILNHGLEFFQNTPMGDLSTRMSYNAQAARDVLDLVITSFGRDATSLVSLIAVMLVQDPVLSIGAFLIMPPAVIGVSKLVKRVRKVARSEFQGLAEIVTIVQETSLGIRIIKAFGLEGRMQKAMNKAVEDVERRSNKMVALNARTSPLMETLGGFAVAGVIMYGGWAVIHLNKDPGSFFSFITALLLAYEPAKRLARLQVQLESGLIGVRMLYELLDRKPTLVEAPDATELICNQGLVRFDNVRFGYGRGPVINDLTLDFPAGKVSALVGPSGAGKSTILALIERFYDPKRGRVLIDGQDIKDVTFVSLRQDIALVTQDTFLFQGSVRDNILTGRPGATEQEVIDAAIAANAHEFIVEMQGGYDANVGEGGGRLSGGQRQRVAIARAMLRDAKVLLLDEATSALDSMSESKVQEALQRLMKGRTTIVIAHRLSTVRDADVIHVLDKGRLVQSGSHAQLLAEGGLYSHLHALQFREAADNVADEAAAQEGRKATSIASVA